MKVVIAGGNSYLGKALVDFYHAQSAEVIVLVRKLQGKNSAIKEVIWDGKTIGDWQHELEGADMLINMSGRSVNCRYTEKNKKEIFDSRTSTTKVLGEAVRLCIQPPKVWLNAASATIYRHAEDHAMDEYKGEIGTGFSVEVCKLWEHTFFEQKTPHTRKVALRTAIVLGKKAPVLANLSNLVKIGLGGKQGSGKQMMSWIHEEDFARATQWIYEHTEINGSINLSAPKPLTNADMMKEMRHAYRTFIGIASPKFLLEMGAMLIGTETELILKSRWVYPRRLKESGFEFHFPDFRSAITDLVA